MREDLTFFVHSERKGVLRSGQFDGSGGVYMYVAWWVRLILWPRNVPP